MKLSTTKTHSLITTHKRLYSSGNPIPTTLQATTKLDGYILLDLIKSSTDLGLVSYPQQLHGFLLKSGWALVPFISNALIRFYGGKGWLPDARKVFVEIPQPNLLSWNTLISGHLRSGKPLKAIQLFIQLQKCDCCGDNYSFASGFSACSQLRLLTLGRSIHCKALKLRLDCVVVGNCLIDMYGKCGSVVEATQVFSEMVEKDNVSWNSVIGASARNGELALAMRFLSRMPQPETCSYNELIWGFVQFGNMENAVKVLKTMPCPNSTSWNSVILGYFDRYQGREAMRLFVKMQRSGVMMDEFTFSILFTGIGNIADLKWGRVVHCFAIKCGLDKNRFVGTSLIDMYSKCGCLKDAEKVFRSLPYHPRTWTNLLLAHLRNSGPEKVIQLFEEMKMDGCVKPNETIFIYLIDACLNGEVPFENAIGFFESMVYDYGIRPTVEQSCSMIRLMGQRGGLLQAKRMIRDLNFETCGVLWRALLDACETWKNLEIAKIAAAKVIQLDGDVNRVYGVMSNILGSCKKRVNECDTREQQLRGGWKENLVLALSKWRPWLLTP